MTGVVGRIEEKKKGSGGAAPFFPLPTRTGLVILSAAKELVALLVRQKGTVEVTTGAIIIFQKSSHSSA
jgi:hypothetical protein